MLNKFGAHTQCKGIFPPINPKAYTSTITAYLQFNQSPGLKTQPEGQRSISPVMSRPLSLPSALLCPTTSAARSSYCLFYWGAAEEEGSSGLRGQGVRKHLTKPDAFAVIQSTHPRKQHAPANMQKNTPPQRDIINNRVTSRGTIKAVNEEGWMLVPLWPIVSMEWMPWSQSDRMVWGPRTVHWDCVVIQQQIKK